MKKALVVDNNEVILKILSHTLQKRGVQVQTAKDGISALQVLEHFLPDIVFTDLIMPNIDGENLCRIISGREDMPTPLLIVVSAIAVEDDLDFLSFGAHACIAKGPASVMAASIDCILEYLESGQIDLLKGKLLGAESLVPRTIARELLEAKQHFQLIFDNIDNGLIEFTRSGTIVQCNAYANKIFDKKILEILSDNLLELFKDPARQHVEECFTRFLSERSLVESVRSVKVGGKDIVFKFINIPGSSSGTAIMIIKDITNELLARKRLKDNLNQLEELVVERTRKYEEANLELQKKIIERKKINEELEFVAKQWSNTFDTLTDFVSIHDKDFKFVRVNKALADFLGEEPENIMGKYCYELMHGREEPWESCPHIAALAEGKPVTYEVDDDNIGVPLLVTCSPLKHDDGSLLGSVHVARDVSEQKKEAELREKLISQLEDSLAKVKILSGFIPICASCKKVRDDSGYWRQVEEYFRDHSEAEFSHSICPSCAKRLYPDFIKKDDEK